MPPVEILQLAIGPAGAAVTLALLSYALYSGRLVRGSEYAVLKERYEALVSQRIEELEERARTTPALAEMAERRQREIDEYIRSRQAPPGRGSDA